MKILNYGNLLESENPRLGSLTAFNYKDNLELGLFIGGGRGDRYILSLSYSEFTEGPSLLLKDNLRYPFYVLQNCQFIPHLSFGKNLTDLRFQDYRAGTLFQYPEGFAISAYWDENTKLLVKIEDGKLIEQSLTSFLAFPSWKIIHENPLLKKETKTLFS